MKIVTVIQFEKYASQGGPKGLHEANVDIYVQGVYRVL